MDGMSRDRAYTPLEVDDRAGRKTRDRQKFRSSGSNSLGCLSLQFFLPAVLRCSQPGLQLAYDALEEDFTDLELR
jgi:hypothetical protein